MKKTIWDAFMIGLGILLLGAGLFLLKLLDDPQGIWRTLPYVCIGLGCGTFGHGVGSCVSRKAEASDPALQKQKAIEQNDERNVSVANHAKAKAYDWMIFIFGALMLAFALMGVDTAAILLLVFAYLVVVSLFLYYHGKYNREM